ncbi:hypothetical protein [Metarhizobium album]|uniref:hypothetical protein n=1 Tax=Metarhizobium album TaxID=2182425 RepID=UPI000FFF5D23|nr:hypothetical protein [Rhizobium album]
MLELFQAAAVISWAAWRSGPQRLAHGAEDPRQQRFAAEGKVECLFVVAMMKSGFGQSFGENGGCDHVMHGDAPSIENITSTKQKNLRYKQP